MKKILFVCMGNICRSPTAEGVLRHVAFNRGLADDIVVDSAGTIGFHAGEPPDKRAVQHAAKRGYDLSRIRAREINQPDYELFDYVLAMDKQNIAWLKKQIPNQYAHKLRLFLEFSENYAGRDVPDPYYGNAQGFEAVLDMVEDGVQGLIDHLIETEAAALNKK
jgi:protein-tyrosine phosphatase